MTCLRHTSERSRAHAPLLSGTSWQLRRQLRLCLRNCFAGLLGALAGVLLNTAGTASAADDLPELPVSADTAAAVPPLPGADAIGSLSDAELTALSVHWSQLSPEQRRVLLKTVRMRMLLEDRNANGSSPLKPQRRFGRIVRKRDGSVVSIETHVYRSADGTGGSISRRMTFGAGFEQRQRSAREDVSAPGDTVAEPSRTATPPR